MLCTLKDSPASSLCNSASFYSIVTGSCAHKRASNIMFLFAIYLMLLSVIRCTVVEVL